MEFVLKVKPNNKKQLGDSRSLVSGGEPEQLRAIRSQGYGNAKSVLHGISLDVVPRCWAARVGSNNPMSLAALAVMLCQWHM